VSLSGRNALASRRALEDPKGHSKRCVMTFVADERICKAVGGTPLPLDLTPSVETQQGASSRVLARAKLADVVSEPGVANLDDPDQRGVWIWDL